MATIMSDDNTTVVAAPATPLSNRGSYSSLRPLTPSAADEEAPANTNAAKCAASSPMAASSRSFRGGNSMNSTSVNGLSTGAPSPTKSAASPSKAGAAHGSPFANSSRANVSAASSPVDDLRRRTRQLMLEARSTQKGWSQPSSMFRSSTPRLAAPRAAAPGMYSHDKASPKALKSGWGISKVPQREEARRITDRFYDPKMPEEVMYMQRGPQSVPATPRMPPTPNNKVPPVGRYTSQYISCGMGM